MQAAGNRDHRRACNEGSHSSAADDIAKVQYGSYGRISEGKVGNSYLQGLSSGEEKRNFTGRRFRVRGYCVSTVGLEENPRVHQKPRKSIEATREWVHGFVQWYNNEHHHSGIRFVTPNQRHQKLDKEILEKRKAVYEAVKEKNPQRWSGKTRDWSLVTEVWLNPPKEVRAEEQKLSKAA